MSAITISIRELHARTGHFVRKSAEMPVIITDNGKPVAEIQPLSQGNSAISIPRSRPTWQDRVLTPKYAAIAKRAVGGVDSTVILSEDRDR